VSGKNQFTALPGEAGSGRRADIALDMGLPLSGSPIALPFNSRRARHQPVAVTKA